MMLISLGACTQIARFECEGGIVANDRVSDGISLI